MIAVAKDQKTADKAKRIAALLDNPAFSSAAAEEPDAATAAAPAITAKTIQGKYDRCMSSLKDCPFLPDLCIATWKGTKESKALVYDYKLLLKETYDFVKTCGTVQLACLRDWAAESRGFREVRIIVQQAVRVEANVPERRSALLEIAGLAAGSLVDADELLALVSKAKWKPKSVQDAKGKSVVAMRKLTLECALERMVSSPAKPITNGDRTVILNSVTTAAMRASMANVIYEFIPLFEAGKVVMKGASGLLRCARAGLLARLWHEEMRAAYPEHDLQFAYCGK